VPYDYSKTLNPEKALIWRIVHRDNIPWILDNGLYCGNSATRAPNWVSIGNPDLTCRRAMHPVPLHPGGCLNDYVPFYFTPFSVMLRNINTGWGVPRRSNEEIVILVSSLHRLREQGLPFVFTDSHAFYQWANFYSDLADLKRVDWPLLQRRDFKRDDNDLAKFERYQAEALVHNFLPVNALVGIVCYTDALRASFERMLTQRSVILPVYARTEWYF
jgi:hypothetical protein